MQSKPNYLNESVILIDAVLHMQCNLMPKLVLTSHLILVIHLQSKTCFKTDGGNESE